MDLKSICLQNMVSQIKQLPPLLHEEVLGYSLQTINEEAKKQAKKELLEDSEIVINDLTDIIVKARKNGNDWVRPEYTKNIDDDIYNNFVHISEMIVNKYSQQIHLFDNHEFNEPGYTEDSDDSEY